MLKEWRRRYVARVAVPGADRTIIFKVCRLSDPFSWLTWRGYALRELEHMRLAQQRGIAVPRPFAFFVKRRLGVVVATGLVMEDLTGWRDLQTLARDSNVGTLGAARLAIAPLRRLYEIGALHADARDENILFSPSGTEFSVIDWQHAAFHAPSAPWLLEHLAAYYIRKSADSAQAELIETWLPELAGASDTAERRAFINRVVALLRKPPSTRARRALSPGRTFA